MAKRVPSWVVGLFPEGSVYGDHLTTKGHRFLRAVGLVIAAGFAATAGILLIIWMESKWPASIGGVAIGTSITLLVSAHRMYRSGTADMDDRVQSLAEFDFLHARLNQIAAALGARTVSLMDGELDAAVRVRKERIAHLSGLDEHRPELQVEDTGWKFWDNEAYGIKE